MRCVFCAGVVLFVANTATANAQFATAPLLPAGTDPSAVVATDFNNDGKLDFAVANQISPGTVSVFLGNGRGQFESATAFSTNASYCVAIAAGDFNGDGSPDIAALNNCNSLERCSNGTLSVALGNGDGTFQLATNYDIGITPKSLAIGDLNHDGKLDIVVASASSGFISVFVGNGDGTFAPAVNYTL